MDNFMSEPERLKTDFYVACDLVWRLVVYRRTTSMKVWGAGFFRTTNNTTCGAATAVTTHSSLFAEISGSLLLQEVRGMG